MQETSSLDMQMEKIVKGQLNNVDLEDTLKPVLDSVFENVLKNAEEKFKRASKRKLKAILKDNVLFNSSQKIFALGEILKIMGEQDFSQEYADEIILIRNQFAHSELMDDGKGNNYFKVKGEEVYFDEELCREIRKNIRKHGGNIRKIEDLIS